jgi:hypothetical protein
LNTLSGGESQRLKLVSHLNEGGGRKAEGGNLFIFDEPTTGLHFDDVAMLLKLFQRLVDAGHSIVVIEHNLEVVKCADWIIDLGPEAGNEGGEVVGVGTPEQLTEVARSHTGKFLKHVIPSGTVYLPRREGSRDATLKITPRDPSTPLRYAQDDRQGYGVVAGVVAGAGAGLPKLKFTVGGFSAPACASKNGRGWNPNMPANRFVGKVRTAVLYSWTALLKFPRSTEIRFSVPSNCACKFWKFCVARSSG